MKKIICLLGMAAMFNFGTVNAQVVKEKHKRPMSRGAKSSIIGGVAGAGVGALVGGGKGAIIGGAVGAGGGYLYGHHRDKKYGPRPMKHKRKVYYR